MKLRLNPYYVLIFCGLCSLMACQQTVPQPLEALKAQRFFKYVMDEPNAIYELPEILNEISGLGVYADSQLVCIQDEKGVLFFFGILSGRIEYAVNFSADGDYEGVTCVGETVYALRADGVLFRVNHWDTLKHPKLDVEVFDTPLDEENDTEGLTYDPQKNDLWIACKQSPKIGRKGKKNRAVYRYDLDTFMLDAEPRFKISRKAYEQFVKTYYKETAYYEKLRKAIKKAKKAVPIEPSAIALHPITGDVYLLAATGNNLLVLDTEGEIKYLHYLPPDEYEQPEGIAFASNGDMYISSEGKDHKAKIFRFAWISSLE